MRRWWWYWVVVVVVVGLGWVPPGAALGAPLPADATVVSFAQLGAAEVTLHGPVDAAGVSFRLPVTWQVAPGAVLRLNLQTFFAGRTSPDGRTAVARSFGGTLRVQVNATTVATVVLDQPRERTVTLPISTTALLAPHRDGRQSLSFTLETGEPCGAEQFTSVVVRPSSALVVPHTLVPPPIDLARLPLPIVQQSFLPDAATVVLPDTPSAGELQAALTVAAGFGRLAGRALTLAVTTSSQLLATTQQTQHVVFIGRASAFPQLPAVGLPAPPQGGAFAVPGGGTGGVVQMARSPWSATHVVLVVGGADDAAVVAAAQAVSGGAVRTSGRADLAVVAAVPPQTEPLAMSVDRSFADLGYETQQMTGVGSQYAGYAFALPPGQVVNDEAYLDVVFVHSALLDYDQASLTVSLNDEPIASVRLDDSSTQFGQVHIVLPAAVMHGGTNFLLFRADLVPRAVCSYSHNSDLWMAIRPESMLHVPFGPATGDQTPRRLNLSRYPAPFTTDATLDRLAFVLPPNDLVAWQTAVQIAYDLGQHVQGSLVQLHATTAPVLPAAFRQDFDLLLVGRPTMLPLLAEVGAALPAPFPPGSNVATEISPTVRYQMPPDASLGYLQLVPVPWNPRHTLLAVLGSTDQAVAWAGAALFSASVRAQLSGNLAIIYRDQVESRDIKAQDAAVTPTPTPAPESTGESRPTTLLFLSIGVIGLLIVVALTALIIWWRRRSVPARHQEESASSPQEMDQ